jgi:hypothetical protein
MKLGRPEESRGGPINYSDAELCDLVPSPTSVDAWWMIGFMPAVGALVRCTDGSWMTRPHRRAARTQGDSPR